MFVITKENFLFGKMYFAGFECTPIFQNFYNEFVITFKSMALAQNALNKIVLLNADSADNYEILKVDTE